jgi:hypothetical protein
MKVKNLQKTTPTITQANGKTALTECQLILSLYSSLSEAYVSWQKDGKNGE